MKRNIIIIFLMLLALNAVSQRDTSKFKSMKEIYIELNLDLENLNNTLEDFLSKIDEKQKKIEKLNDSLLIVEENKDKDVNYQAHRDSIKLLIKINKDMIEALEKGVEDINKSIEKLNKQIDSMQKRITIEEDLSHSSSKTKKFRGHWSGIEFGLNSFWSNNFNPDFPTQADFLYLDQAKSWFFNWNVFQFSIPFSRNIGIVTGGGLCFNNYELKYNYNLAVDDNGNLIFINSNFSYSKNRFKTLNVTLPALFEFQIPLGKTSKKAFINFGVIAMYNIQNKMKYQYLDNNFEVKYKDRTTAFPVNPFNYEFVVKIGYDDIYLTANYRNLSIFLKNKAPEVYNFSAGLGIKF